MFFYRRYIFAFCIVSPSFSALSGAIPLAIEGDLRHIIYRVKTVRENPLQPQESAQTSNVRGLLYFYNKRANYRVVFEETKSRAATKVPVGLFMKTPLRKVFRRLKLEIGERVLLDLGDGLYAAGTFQTLIADISSTEGGKLFAAFEIFSLVPPETKLSEMGEPIDKSSVPELKATVVEVPLETLTDRVYPLIPSLFSLSESTEDQAFFLELDNGPAVPVLVLGYRGIGTDGLISPDSYAEVVLRRDVERRSQSPAIYRVPAMLLRKAMGLGNQARIRRSRLADNQPPAWLKEFRLPPLDDIKQLPFGMYFRALQARVWNSDMMLPPEKPEPCPWGISALGVEATVRDRS